MRPVNLLPEEYRPRRRSGAGRRGSSYFLLGGMGLVLVMVVVYVLTANTATDRRNQATEVGQEAKQTRAEAAALKPYGDFASVKQARTSAVEALARSRFDWERYMRELARLLPEGTWLKEANTVTSGVATGGGSTGSSSGGSGGSSATAAAQGTGGPNSRIVGCAKRQSDVARFMVRLRRMSGVMDVALVQSDREQSESGAGQPVSPAGGGAGGGGAEQGSDSCGNFYKFEVTLAFEPIAAVASGGGGAPGGAPGGAGGAPVPTSGGKG